MAEGIAMIVAIVGMIATTIGVGIGVEVTKARDHHAVAGVAGAMITIKMRHHVMAAVVVDAGMMATTLTEGERTWMNLAVAGEMLTAMMTKNQRVKMIANHPQRRMNAKTQRRSEKLMYSVMNVAVNAGDPALSRIPVPGRDPIPCLRPPARPLGHIAVAALPVEKEVVPILPRGRDPDRGQCRLRQSALPSAIESNTIVAVIVTIGGRGGEVVAAAKAVAGAAVEIEAGRVWGVVGLVERVVMINDGPRGRSNILPTRVVVRAGLIVKVIEMSAVVGGMLVVAGSPAAVMGTMQKGGVVGMGTRNGGPR